jgi:DNA-binding Xre family transcriptional regulator
MARSLKASEQGIEKAKKALIRNNYTQVALAKEVALASWATISKFFNGKGIDRRIFQEICHFLDLDWQEIAAVEVEEVETVETSESDTESFQNVESIIQEAFTKASPGIATWDVVHHCATRTRAALDPYILPLIRRDALVEKCLKQIRMGVFEQKRRVIPVLGSAGYGKSTILGTIYDELDCELRQAGQGWIALARCDDFIESAENFGLELGEKVSSQRISMVEVAKALTQTHHRGILLLDTLDIILSPVLVPVLRRLFSELLELGTTVVFTCRETDYCNFFEPYHESFAGFRESVYDGCKIPPFNEAEVLKAAQEFARIKLNFPTLESQQTFAEQIIALSADSQSLSEIVCHPLLLALLCDLFALEGTVPEDLTVSQLYDKYWDWKIAKVRHNTLSPYLGRAKETLCLKITEKMYKTSSERLRDFAYDTALDLQNEIEFSAYQSLLSDGILKDLGRRRIGFFHQTFLEYAIARWLNDTETGHEAKTTLKHQIVSLNPAKIRYYLWPVFRQLLTQIPLEEFQQTTEELDTTQLLPFRCVAFASVSRTEPTSAQVLFSLLKVATDYTFQETLLVVANSAPNRHGETVWEVTCRLLSQVGTALINKALEMTTELLVRFLNPAVGRFEQALLAIQESPLIQAGDLEQQHHIWGKFISSYCQQLQQKGAEVNPEILPFLKNIYAHLSSQARASVIGLYLAPAVSESLQQEFLITILQIPPANNFFEKNNATELLKQLLPSLLKAENPLWGHTWYEALHQPVDDQWSVAVAAAVGHQALTNQPLIRQILGGLLTESSEGTSKEFSRRNLIAAQETITQGGGNILASVLMEIPIQSIPTNRLSTLAHLLRTLAGEGTSTVPVNPALTLPLVQWFISIVTDNPVELIRAVDAFAIKSAPVQQYFAPQLEPLLSGLPLKQAGQILKKLSYIPPQLDSYLRQNVHSKEVRAALLKRVHQNAERGIPSAISEVIQFCLDESRDVAKDAAWMVLSLAEQHQPIEADKLLAVLQNSPVISVRQNCLKAFIEQVNAKTVTFSSIVKIFQVLAHEKTPEILVLLYKLADTTLWNHPSGNRAVELPIAEAIFQLTESVAQIPQKATLDMVAGSAFLTLNQMILLENELLIPKIASCTRLLLRQVDIRGKLDKLLVTGLLNHIEKFLHSFLEQVVREDFFGGDEMMPVANQQAVILAISHAHGQNAALLDEILHHPQTPEAVKSRLLQERGT